MGESEQKIGAIYAQMGEIAKKIGHIARGDKNEFHGYNFRSIDAVYNKVGPLLADAGVFCTVDVGHISREKDGKNWHVVVQITYCFVSTLDGSRVVCNMLGEGMDSGDKAINKAYAAAHKYALLQIFAIPTAEQRDGDFESPESKPKQKKPAEKKPSAPKKPRMDPPVPVQDMDLSEKGLLEACEVSETKNGGNRYAIQINGKKMASFKDVDGKDLMLAFDHGLQVGITYTRNGNWRNISSVTVLDDLPEKTPAEGFTEDNPPPPTDDDNLSDIPF